MTDKEVSTLLFSAAAALLAGMGLYHHFARRRVIKNGQRATGVVMHNNDLYLRSMEGFDDEATYIKFTLADGTEMISEYFFGNFSFREGRQVTVIYDRDNPHKYIVVTGHDTSKWGYLFFAASIVMAVLAVLRYNDIISAKTLDDFANWFQNIRY